MASDSNCVSWRRLASVRWHFASDRCTWRRLARASDSVGWRRLPSDGVPCKDMYIYSSIDIHMYIYMSICICVYIYTCLGVALDICIYICM